MSMTSIWPVPTVATPLPVPRYHQTYLLQRERLAADIMLFLIGRFGLDGGQYQAVEYRGAAIRALPMQERMTLCNMTAELGGQTGLIASDSTTEAFLNAKIEIWESDSGA